jgi:hypothetical protein
MHTSKEIYSLTRKTFYARCFMSQAIPEPEPDSAPLVVSKGGRQGKVAAWMQQSQEILLNWLYEVGGWIFGGLILIALMLIQVLISLGASDRAVLIASIAIGIALPFNLAGIGLVRSFQKIKPTTPDPLRQNAEQETLTLFGANWTPAKERLMASSVTLAIVLSTICTLISLASALWHISWVVTVVFLVASLLGVILLFRGLLAPG